ncbi:MAG: flagellin [Candidatus Thermoplasmatota archaeon]
MNIRMGKNLINILKRKDVGAIGIGAMIVFIAMVLVAGIAASVLIQTAGDLEMSAMRAGEETEAEVATGLAITDIEGHVNTTLKKIDNLTINIKPRAGSNEIDLEQAVLEISNSSTKVVLTWDASAYANSAAGDGVFSTESGVFDVSNTNFGIIELEDADNSASSTGPVINRGDLVMLTINAHNCFNKLPARTDVWGQVIPEEGASGVFSFRTPASLTDEVYDLY